MSRKGITLRNFLPLIEISKKTCRLDITSGGQKQGFLYFDQGVLLNAHCENLTGEPAAWEMIKWDRVSLNLSDLPKEKSRKIIKTELMEIAGALWGKPVKPTSRSRPAGTQNGRPSGSGISKLQASLNRYVNILRTVKGYTGVCILSPDGKILATHKLNESIDFNAFASAFNQMLSDARQTTFQKGFEKCRGLTLHTEKSLILMMAADVMKEGNFRFLVLMESNGNSYFMQVQLAKLIPGILAAR